jgi:hypothetical protein
MLFDEYYNSVKSFISPADTDIGRMQRWAGNYIVKELSKHNIQGVPRKGGFIIYEAHEFGADCFALEDGDVIRMPSGTFEIILGASRAFLSNPTILPSVGTIDRDGTPLKFPGPITAIRTAPHLWEFERLQDSDREATAFSVALGAAMFLAFHELTHVRNAHVDIVKEKLGQTALEEITGPELDEFKALTRQTLEWDADLIAAQELLQSALTPEIDTRTQPYGWKLNISSEEMKLRLEKVAMAITVVHGLMVGTYNIDENFHQKNHPPLWFRAMYCRSQIIEQFRLRNVEGDLGEISSWIADCFNRADNAIVYILGIEQKPRSKEDYERDLALYEKAAEKYTSEWKSLWPRMDVRKRAGTLAPPEPFD